uniref:Invasion protein IalB, involved in pathogenesis n=1 Tax=Candidatus Kentrum sp. FW TaxID=2126338 RepID=A0A450TUI8_9GAMM|nr:MAG: Invasion protein IalB, involved in pathogenesis [Candidatus Kentron sp. FW]
MKLFDLPSSRAGTLRDYRQNGETSVLKSRSSRRPLRNIATILVSIALLMSFGGVSAKEETKNKNIESTAHGDWELLCPKGKDKKEKGPCILAQRIMLEINESKSKLPIVSFQFVHTGKPRALHAILSVSLLLEGGVVLAPGVRLEIGDKKKQKPVSWPFSHCNTNGCSAASKVPSKLRKQLQAANKVNVSFQTVSGKTITVPSSLRGITAGLKALDKKN